MTRSHKKTCIRNRNMSHLPEGTFTLYEARVSLLLTIEARTSILARRIAALRHEVRDLDRLRLILAAQRLGRVEDRCHAEREMRMYLQAINAWDYWHGDARRWNGPT